MTITVKKLINELEKIENKFLEVEIYILDKKHNDLKVDYVRKVDKKVLLFVS